MVQHSARNTLMPILTAIPLYIFSFEINWRQCRHYGGIITEEEGSKSVKMRHSEEKQIELR